ncbi:MAG: 1-acyl-sn-glycerol-3-phosphate acyltransferase, partial [Rhodospirillaceae bacterium]
VYRAALARPFVPVLSTNLHRSWLGKILFPGLSVSRAKDRAQGSTNARANLAALERCVETLAANHDVLIFPEGTSALGPVPLPFETGAASLAQRFLKTHSQLTIVPLSVRYDAPWSYGSTAEVLAGPPITVHSADIKAGQDGKTVLHQQFSEALETLFHRHHFGDADLTIRHRQPWQTVLGLCSLPLCALALLLCAPALLAGFGAGRLLADGPNVISLWRVLIGGPVLLFWLPLLLLALGLLTSPLIAAGAGLSILGGLRQVGAARTALSLWRAQPPQTRRIR